MPVAAGGCGVDARVKPEQVGGWGQAEGATDDAGAKSYDHGVPLQVGLKPVGDLVIFQGPLLLVPTPRIRKPELCGPVLCR